MTANAPRDNRGELAGLELLNKQPIALYNRANNNTQTQPTRQKNRFPWQSVLAIKLNFFVNITVSRDEWRL